MRFCLVVLGLLILTAGLVPAANHPVYVHEKTRKAKRHHVPKHRSVQQ